MADNIIIKITTEADLTAAQKQLKDMESAAYDLTKQMADLKKAEAEELKALEAKIKKSQEAIAANKKYIEENQLAAKAAEQFNKAIADEEKNIEETNRAIDAARKKHKELIMTKQDEIKANKQSINEYNKQIKSYKLLQGEGGRMVQQLRVMREELQRMEDSGQFGSKAFMDLAIAAGKLEDQIGDTQQRIRILSSDTAGLDAVMGVADGAAGAFYVATSAAEVFGGELEGLQEAFYKVQAAMSVMSGVQQIANTLNKDSAASVVLLTAAEKVREKVKAREAALERLANIQKLKGVATDGAKTVSTGLLTKAQVALNAAMTANPIGMTIALVLTAIAALGALGVGIFKIVGLFTDAGKAQRDFAKASKELENIQRENAVGQATRAQQQQELLRKMTDAHEEELRKAEARNASEVEMAQISLRQAKEKHDAIAKYNGDEIKKNDEKIAQLEIMVAAKEREVEAFRKGSRKKKKAQEELTEVEQQLAEARQKNIDLDTEQQDAWEAQQEAAKALVEARKQMRLDAEQANIDLMREGAAKEIAQIKVNYREQLKAVQDNSEEEIALRKALLKKQAKEIADVQRKYALQAQETAIQEHKNLLTAMSQASGTEADYEKQIALTKKIAEAEAQAKIDALDKNVLSEKEYAAQVEAIRLELNNTLRDIDEQEVQRLNENAKRKTEIALMEAEAATNALKGSESVEYQKAAWENYYNERAKQVEENAKHEIEAINRSTDSEEVKAEKVKQIELQLQADLEAIRKEGAQKAIDIDAQYLDELQRNVEKAERDVEKAQGGGKLAALEERLNAELALYDEQRKQLNEQWESGVITDWQEFENQRWEITKATEDAIAAYREEKMQTILDGFNTALGYMQEISDMAFGAINDNIQAEMDALDEMYTTDAQEAKENSNKKYISEKELADKKAALEMKQAKYAKSQALINAAINTAQAIVTTLAQLGATPWGIAASVIAGAMGAAQIGIIASKPLAQYAKGRKGGKGEYALVGEKGPEVMYVPDGASIVPNHYLGDMDAWSKFGVPALPNDMMSAAMLQQINIDYDRLGKAVAANIPQQKAVSVNVDRSGVTISDNGNRRTYLNHKYAGSWS
jgi:hypothetical protein